jgi:uncharacterized repeat protein (TIGR03803 family)
MSHTRSPQTSFASSEVGDSDCGIFERFLDCRCAKRPEGKISTSAIRALFLLSAAVTLVAVSLTEARANKERVLYSFTDGADSSLPLGVIRDDQGAFYGTALGDRSNCIAGTAYCGAVFKLTPKGKEKTIYTFQGGERGSSPAPGLVADATGNLFGAASGIVFKISPNGTEHVFHTFNGYDGADPRGDLIIDSNGNLYGTTYQGGASNYGTVYRLNHRGKITMLYSFPGGGGGAYPNAGLYRDTGGNLYGTTLQGGQGCEGSGCGTVFEVTPDGTGKVLYAFMGGNDGANPIGSVVMDASGALYGGTQYGGLDCYHFGFGCGTLFKVTASGNETVLHTFTGDDGATPDGGLIRDASGNLYGAAGGGADKSGVVFEFTDAGEMKTLYSFTGAGDGNEPSSHLIMDEGGNLYGATLYGGAFGYGTVFKIANH